MSIEDEYALTFKNVQVREDDGWRVTKTEVDNVDADSYYINEHRVVHAPVNSSVQSINWTPNSFDVYNPTQCDWRRRLHLDG